MLSATDGSLSRPDSAVAGEAGGDEVGREKNDAFEPAVGSGGAAPAMRDGDSARPTVPRGSVDTALAGDDVAE